MVKYMGVKKIKFDFWFSDKLSPQKICACFSCTVIYEVTPWKHWVWPCKLEFASGTKWFISTVNLCSTAAQDVADKLKNSEFVLLACQEIVFGWKMWLQWSQGGFFNKQRQEAEEACIISCNAWGCTVKVSALCRWLLDCVTLCHDLWLLSRRVKVLPEGRIVLRLQSFSFIHHTCWRMM